MLLSEQQVLSAIHSLGSEPSPISRRLKVEAKGDDLELSSRDIDAILSTLVSDDPNFRPRVVLLKLMRDWDNVGAASWTDSTPAHSPQRRRLLHKLLGWDASVAAKWDESHRLLWVSQPLEFTEGQTEWYTAERKVNRDFYWRSYSNTLATAGWTPDSLAQLDSDTDAVVRNLADPTCEVARTTRGLVVGYVQSGKTANFTGVIAKAGDAGYRLVIVLAGTLNTLREQTQRRIDKELVGWELSGLIDSEYEHLSEGEREEFVKYGRPPSEQNSFDWNRLTGANTDYQKLGGGASVLRYYRSDRSRPLYDPANLFPAAGRIIVVKKNGSVLRKLLKDLRVFKQDLCDVPALVIDDESDQAGVNTSSSNSRPTSINESIRSLLALLPRGQYIGYTATPYANVLIDPENAADLFPRNFIVCLKRPLGYIGLREFFGVELDGDEHDIRHKLTNQVSAGRDDHNLVRLKRISGNDGPHLKQAVDMFVLTGALKLYRQDVSANDADSRRLRFKHHTMLVHISSRQAEHSQFRDTLLRVWREAEYHSTVGMSRLAELWTDVDSKCRQLETQWRLPSSFDELRSYISKAISLIEQPTGALFDPVLIVNGNDEEATTPNFERDKVWKILVGGNKLSRGYTIEGLTVSYYRRATRSVDTLMQMGRWFGFRRGYDDLVRLYVATDARQGKGFRDIVDDFVEACWVEEVLRNHLAVYAAGPTRVLPRELPPTIAYSQSLAPTARNKMRSAKLVGVLLPGNRSSPTKTATTAEDIRKNQAALGALLARLAPTEHTFEPSRAGDRGLVKLPRTHLVHAWTDAESIARFLEALQYGENDELAAQIQLVKLPASMTNIHRWRVLHFPIADNSKGPPFETGWSQPPALNVIERRRATTNRFNVLSASSHATVARWLVGNGDGDGDDLSQLVSGVEPDERSAVLSVYVVRAIGDEGERPVHVGIEFFFPKYDQSPYYTSASLPTLT